MRPTRNKLTATFLMMCIFLFPTFADAIPSVSLELMDSDIMDGETFGIGVVANGVERPEEVVAFGFDLDFNPAEFSFAGWVPGDDFWDDTLLESPPPLQVAGSARLFDENLDLLPPVSGDNILLASLFFTAEMAGDFQIGILSDLYDPETGDPNPWAGLITAIELPTDITQSIDVNVSSAPVPEPATILLMAAGITGLGLFSRRRKNGKI